MELGAVCPKHEERKRGLFVNYSKWGQWLRVIMARAETNYYPGFVANAEYFTLCDDHGVQGA